MSEQQQERSPESLRHEYTEVIQNIRHYSNLRFAVFSIFFAVIGGLGLVAFGKEQFDPSTALVARIAGVPVIAVFWMYEERLNEFFEHYFRMAVELERSLGYTQYTAGPHRDSSRLPKTEVIWRLFFFLLTLLWLYATFALPLGS